MKFDFEVIKAFLIWLHGSSGMTLIVPCFQLRIVD